MDCDDPIDLHGVTYDKVQELLTLLPPGWIRHNPSEIQPGQAPYLHEPSGTSSWKNPNFDKIKDMVNAATEEGKRKQSGNDGYEKKVKKLRLLLQAGAPLGAIQQKAKLEGVNMSSILSPKPNRSKASSVTDDEGDSIISQTLMKKYKRMIKAGVPMDRVQQLAGLESGASPEQIFFLLKGDASKSQDGTRYNHEPKGCEANNATALNRLTRTSVQLQRSDTEKNAVLGDLHDEVNNESESNVLLLSGEILHTIAPKSEISHFTPLIGKDKVVFPSSHGDSIFPLTDLVRKMVQTVVKTARFDCGAGKDMIVDVSTLFHALGALKGVQFARNEYKSTIGYTLGCLAALEITNAKRHGFLEMLRNLGLNHDDNDSYVDIDGLDDLILYIESINSYELNRSSLLIKDGFYDFDSLHALYPPGSFVIAKHAGGGGIDCLTQVLWHRYTQGKTIMGKTMKYFELCVRYIVPLGGGRSTFAEVVSGIEMFEGRRSLVSSVAGAALGLAFVPPTEEESLRLIQRYSIRGEMYNRIASRNKLGQGKSHAYMEYDKGCFFQKRGGLLNSAKASANFASSGRIVIDFDGAVESGHCISLGRDDMLEGLQLKLKEYKLHLRSMEQNKGTVSSLTSSNGCNMIFFEQIPPEYIPLVWPSLVGFSLTAKSWGDVIIDGLTEIIFDPEIFDRLVLPDSRKKMIKALVKHTNIDGGFHDIVKGKGEGTVFLLYGEPGNGKTLTAEAVAEVLHCPLYSVSMGTLGTTADELERRFSDILQLSSKWNALVLLDEADSILEARSTHSSLERNAMVSVMLRLIEYHQGILFLTSNRIDCLDPAFQTRITLAIRYEALDLNGRAQVWKNLLEKSGFASCLPQLDIKALAGPVLNGREIKNALRISMAMASDQGGYLTQDLLLESAIVVNGSKDSIKLNWRVQDSSKRLSCNWVTSFWR